VQGTGPGAFKVLANHVYDTPGSYTITTTITDDGGQTATAIGTATIGLYEGQAYSVSIQVAAPGPQPSYGTPYTATIAWGDGTSTPGDVSPLTSDSGVQLLVTGDHVYYEEGNYTVTATVTDPNSGYQASGTASVWVEDAPLAGYGTTITADAGT